MDNATTTTDTTADLVRHPVWCRHVPDGAPGAGDPIGSKTFYDRLAPADPGEQHEGRTYQVDAGYWTYTVEAALTQQCDEVDPSGVAAMHVRLTIENHELMDARQAVWLQLDEVERVIEMLQRVVRDAR